MDYFDYGYSDNSTEYMKKAALAELRTALKLRQMNDELLEYLTSSLDWLMHYADKNQIPLPERDKMSRMSEKVWNMYKNMCSS